uniref:PI3K/PI4K domain-containing protein n=1 Tax=Heterorhabditis bacteriophora TaxID=37862 RepID=A0A1I7WBG1_HETBA
MERDIRQRSLLRHYAELMHCLNYDQSVIMDSVKLYLGARNVKYVPEKKPGGSNAGLIFDYSHDGTKETFYLKANEVNWSVNPDARELIVYLLLKHIGVGPSKCYFIPIICFVIIVFENNLKMNYDLDLITPMDETIAVELHLLAILLNLTDLNTENFGLNSNGSLSIVDFSLTKAYKVKKNYLLVYLFIHLLIQQNQFYFYFRILHVRVASKSIYVGSRFSKIWIIWFLDRATGAIKEYLESVKWNIQKLTNEWDEESLHFSLFFSKLQFYFHNIQKAVQ